LYGSPGDRGSSAAARSYLATQVAWSPRIDAIDASTLSRIRPSPLDGAVAWVVPPHAITSAIHTISFVIDTSNPPSSQRDASGPLTDADIIAVGGATRG